MSLIYKRVPTRLSRHPTPSCWRPAGSGQRAYPHPAPARETVNYRAMHPAWQPPAAAASRS